MRSLGAGVSPRMFVVYFPVGAFIILTLWGQFCEVSLPGFCFVGDMEKVLAEGPGGQLCHRSSSPDSGKGRSMPADGQHP